MPPSRRYGWRLPETLTGHATQCVSLRIPNDSLYRAAFYGAILDLTKAYYWGETDADAANAEIAAEYWRSILLPFADKAPNGACGAPIAFDNAEDTDDELADIEYPVLEQAADWIITGFLAVTFTPAIAAIYRATIPRIRLALRAGRLGAAFRVLVNGILVLADTTLGDTDGEIRDFYLDLTPPAGSDAPPYYEIRIEHAGIAGEELAIVRGDIRDLSGMRDIRQQPNCKIQSQQANGTWLDKVDLTLCQPTFRLYGGRLQIKLAGSDVWQDFEETQGVEPADVDPQGSADILQCEGETCGAMRARLLANVGQYWNDLISPIVSGWGYIQGHVGMYQKLISLTAGTSVTNVLAAAPANVYSWAAIALTAGANALSNCVYFLNTDEFSELERAALACTINCDGTISRTAWATYTGIAVRKAVRENDLVSAGLVAPLIALAKNHWMHAAYKHSIGGCYAATPIEVTCACDAPLADDRLYVERGNVFVDTVPNVIIGASTQTKPPKFHFVGNCEWKFGFSFRPVYAPQLFRFWRADGTFKDIDIGYGGQGGDQEYYVSVEGGADWHNPNEVLPVRLTFGEPRQIV